MLHQIIARPTISGISPLCQSRFHDEPKLEGETNDAYDLRTWRGHMHVKDGTVHIPAKALHDALSSAAKYSKRQIPGQWKATWTAKFASGIAIFEDVDLGIDPKTVDCVAVYCNANGRAGSGSRVIRRFPIMPQWTTTFDVTILDPIITEDIFTEMLEQAGMYVGIGQNRPQNRGVHGRFKVTKVEWIGERQIDLRRRSAA